MLRHSKLIAFVSVFFLVWFYNLHIGVTKFWYDSSLYWDSGYLFTSSGHFSWLTYEQPLRGYILPFLSFICMAVAKVLGLGDMHVYRFASAIFYACFLAVLLPMFYEKVSNKKVSLIHILSFFALVFYFWRGFFLYPLSDFVSLFFITLASYNIISYFSKRGYWKILSAGFFIALSSSARPSYQIVLIPIILLFIIHSYIKKDPKKNIIISLVFLIFGMGIAYGPQLYINKNKYDVVSPFIQTGIVYKGESLFVQQLLWGLYIQKYETNTNTETYPNASMFFYDQQGINLLNAEHVINYEATGVQPLEKFSLKKYITIAIKHPFDVMSIYIKHIFNGIDLIHHSVYLTDVYKSRIIFSFFNYTLWFISLYTILASLRKKSFIKNNYFSLSIIGIIMLPSLLSMPSAIETRFFLPLFILNYMVVTHFLLNKQTGLEFIKGIDFKKIFLYIAFLLICFTWSGITFSNLVDGHYLLNN